MQIELADFEAKDFQNLLLEHLAAAQQNVCTHALGLAELEKSDVHMFTARDADGDLMGCAALKTLNITDGEIKSVRTHPDHLRKGVSRALMAHIETTAKHDGLKSLYLETHNTPAYVAACRMYEKLGYEYCGPFGNYIEDPRSVFMVKSL